MFWKALLKDYKFSLESFFNKCPYERVMNSQNNGTHKLVILRSPIWKSQKNVSFQCSPCSSTKYSIGKKFLVIVNHVNVCIQWHQFALITFFLSLCILISHGAYFYEFILVPFNFSFHVFFLCGIFFKCFENLYYVAKLKFNKVFFAFDTIWQT
jgi:hypothetical protein